MVVLPDLDKVMCVNKDWRVQAYVCIQACAPMFGEDRVVMILYDVDSASSSANFFMLWFWKAKFFRINHLVNKSN